MTRRLVPALFQVTASAVAAPQTATPSSESALFRPIAAVRAGGEHRGAGGDRPRSTCAGMTLLPGLIDAHSHIVLHPYNETLWNDQVLKEPLAYRTIAATIHIRDTLMAGFTTLRDLGTEGRGTPMFRSNARWASSADGNVLLLSEMIMTTRSVAQIVRATPQLEGEGMIVTRPFPTARLDHVDPFLLLDRMGPVTHGPGEAKGAPDHPHRGFETVTYILDGAIEHADSQGNRGRIDAGDVQWMTAGSGVIHSEMPAEEIRRDGGRLHGFQLWVNLPRGDKMMKPRYQELRAAEIPRPTSADGNVTVIVIAGESLGTRATIATRTPIIYLHVRLAAGARFTQPIPQAYNAFAFIVSGEVTFGDRRARENDAVIFERDGDTVVIACEREAELLLIGGVPLNEPVARYGPFVMNTVGEIRQAMMDYQSGRFGEIG